MPSKIKRISVTNLKAVYQQTANFNGCTAIVTGGNNKGKTSFLRGLTDRLRGMKPERILRYGARDGIAELELTTGEKFVWSFTDDKEKLSFITERDIKSSATKEIRKFYFPEIFDIDAFLQAAPKDQKSMIEKLANIELDDINKQIASKIEDRQYAKRKMDEEKIKQKPVITSLPEKIDESYKAIEQEINAAGLHNEKMKNFALRIQDKRTKVTENIAVIKELEEKITALQDVNMQLENEIDLGDNELKKPERQIKTVEYIAGLQAKVDKIELSNVEIEENNKAKEQDKVYLKAIKTWEEADAEVKKLQADKLDAIKNSDLPDGFGFTEDGESLTYNNLHFTKEQQSSSALYIAALKLASVGLGEVKTLHFDASFLDKKSLTEIGTWAHKNDLQLLIERPDYEGGEIEYQIVEHKESGLDG